MVVACKTQQLLINSSKKLTLTSRQYKLTRRYASNFTYKNMFDNTILNTAIKWNFRLCDCRYYHSSRETRSTFAKLTPQEVDSFHDPVCKSAGWSCQDCFTMKLCVNFFGWQNWNQMSCVDKVNSNGKPFCNQVTNVCEEKPSGDCDPSSKFVCTRDGNYPNINNCGKYLQCSDGNLTTVECPTNYVYDHVHGSCVFKLTSSDCKTIRCTNNNYESVPSDPSIYVECENKLGVLQICPEPYQTFNLISKTCEDTCTKAGQSIRNTRNCVHYFQCNDDLKLTEMKCSKGGYSPTSNKCIASYDVLCNELQIYDQIINRLVPKFVLQFLKPITNLLDMFNLNPLKLLMKFGVKRDTIRTSLMVINYVITYWKIPPVIMSNVLDKLLAFLPASLRGIVESILKGVLGIRMAANGSITDRLHFKRYTDEDGTDTDYDYALMQYDDDDGDDKISILLKKLRQYSAFVPQILNYLQFTINELLHSINNRMRRDIFYYDVTGYVKMNPDELRAALLQQYYNALDYYCTSKTYICKYVTNVWKDKHTTRMNDAIDYLQLPLRYEEYKRIVRNDYDTNQELDTIDPFDVVTGALNKLKESYVDGLREICLLIDELSSLLIARLQNSFVKAFVNNFTSINVNDLTTLLEQFRNDLNNYTLKILY